MKLFSIIIPVFKVERYLRECVDSVLSQSFRKIEIILVDDGSPDKCPQICDEYAQKDNRIKVIHKENGGLSDARNAGIKIAQGEYVIFLDSDDYYNNSKFLDSLSAIVAQKSPDVICFQRQQFDDGKENEMKLPRQYSKEMLNEETTSRLVKMLSESSQLEASSCMKAIRRELLLSKNLFFKKGIFSEDIEWFMRLMKTNPSVTVTNEVAYCYRLRPSSISHSVGKKNIDDLYKIVDEYSIIYKETEDSEFKEGMLNYLLYQLFILMAYVHKCLRGEQRAKMVAECRKYLWLNKYAISKKTKLCKMLYLIGGYRFTSVVLSKYLILKKR